LLQVSRLVPRKEHDDLIATLPAILSRQHEVLYVIVGSGSDQQRLEALAGAQGVGKHVLFTGRVADATLPDWYRAGVA
jgi:glycosyltransferase involved in cell wall biosynthesis